MKYLIAVDIGTTGLKLQCVDENFKFLTQYYEVIESQKIGRKVEQSPNKIFRQLITALHQITQSTSGKCAGIVFSSAMHSLILMDANMNCLSKNMTWADQRAGKLAEKLRSNEIGARLFESTGTPIHGMSPAMKIYWLKKYAPSLFKKASFFVGIKEYLIHRLTDNLAIDTSIASATGLFNIWKGNWDEHALQVCGIDSNQLAKLVSPHHQIAIKESIRKKIGVESTCSIIMGASDGCLANLGAAPTEKTTSILSVGTSAALRINLTKIELAKNGELFTYWLDSNRFIMGGASNNGGIILEWFKKTFQTQENLHTLFAQLDRNDYFQEDIFFMPWVYGERAPTYQSKPYFGFIGHTASTSIPQLFLAVLEGILFNIKTILELVEKNTFSLEKILITGGVSKSLFFVKLAANILDKEIKVTDDYDMTVVGAIRLGFESLGWQIDDKTMNHKFLTHKPSNNARYLTKYDNFLKASSKKTQTQLLP